jgi:hypothetical protein
MRERARYQWTRLRGILRRVPGGTVLFPNYGERRDPVKLARLKRRAVTAILTAVLLPLVLITFIVAIRLWSVPAWYLTDRTSAVSAAQAITEYRVAVGPILAVLVQLIGGVLVLAGLLIGWRQLAASRGQHLADRFDRAVEALSSASEVGRIAGVHSLERLARDSEVDRTAVLDALSAFARHAIASMSPSTVTGRTIPHDAQAAIRGLSRLLKTPRPPLPYDPEDPGIHGGVDLGGWIFHGSISQASHFAISTSQEQTSITPNLEASNSLGATCRVAVSGTPASSHQHSVTAC